MFDITTFTLIHVVLSLVGILAGLIVAGEAGIPRRLGRVGRVHIWRRSGGHSG
jgi:hypothetical protein